MKSSDLAFVAAAFLSFVLSVFLWFNNQKDAGLFVGLWVPSILSATILIKLIQIQSTERRRNK